MTTKASPHTLSNVTWGFSTRSDLAAVVPTLSDGVEVAVRGIPAVIDSLAVNKLSALHDLSVDGVRLKGETIYTRWWTDEASGDASDLINAAADYVVANWNDTDSAYRVIYEGNLDIAEPVVLAGTPNVLGGQNIHIDATAAVFNVITGGSLESNSDQSAITVKAREGIHFLGNLNCNHLCGGFLFNECVHARIFGGRAEAFTWRAFTTSGNCAGMDLYGQSGYEWTIGETEFLTDSNFTADGIYLDNNDIRVDAAHIGYCYRPIVFAPGSTGCELHGCHPFNGRTTGTPREHPYCIVNQSDARVYAYDCYVDNGYIDDQTATLTVSSGRHYIGFDRVTMTHPFTRIKVPADPADMEANVFDWDSSVGFYIGAWENDFSNGITNIDYNIGNSRNSQRITDYYRQRTILMPNTSVAFDRQEVKHGNSAQKIEHRYAPGVSPVMFERWEGGVKTIYREDTDRGALSLKSDEMVGLGAVLSRLDLWAGDSAQATVADNGDFKPFNDDGGNLGIAAARWSQVYAVNGSINTSDERNKEQIEDIPQEWLDAWEDVQWTRFKWKDSVETKGDDARWHLGLIAQRVEEVFRSHGIDPFEIGLLCFDEWEDGDRYGIRYEQAFALEAAYQRRRMDRIEEKVNGN